MTLTRAEQTKKNRGRPRGGGRGRQPIPDNQLCIRRDYRAFTIRLPPEMYDKLFAKAADEGRSVAVQIERDLRERYG